MYGDESKTGRFEPPLINIGVGTDVTILELAETIQRVLTVLPNLVHWNVSQRNVEFV